MEHINNIRIKCQYCHTEMALQEDNLYQCPKCGIKEEIIFDVEDCDKNAYPFYNNEIDTEAVCKSNLHCDRCGSPLLSDSNFNADERYKGQVKDENSVGLDCHCLYCGATYSLFNFNSNGK